MGEPSRLAKNLSKSFAELHCEFTELQVTNQELEKRIKTLEIKVFPCKECCLSSCDGCPHKEANH